MKHISITLLLLLGTLGVASQARAQADAAIYRTNIGTFVQGGQNNDVRISVINRSTTPVTSFTMNWQVGSGQIHADPVSMGSPLQQNYYTTRTHSDQLNLSGGGPHDLKIWVSDVNGSATDADPSNDEVSLSVGTVSQLTPRNILLEKVTGTWCGFCPNGTEFVIEAKNQYPNVISLSYHQSDNLSQPDATTFIQSYNDPGSTPRIAMDRLSMPGQDGAMITGGGWTGPMESRLDHPAPASLTMANEYDPATRELTVMLEAEFYADITADIRFSAIISQDSILASGPLAQNNYLCQGCSSPNPNSMWYNRGNPISNYFHTNVVTAMVDGPWGQNTTSSVTDGQILRDTLTYTFPSNITMDNYSVTGMVYKYSMNPSGHEIYNAEQQDFVEKTSTGVDAATLERSLTAYPNPAGDNLSVRFELAGTEEAELSLVNSLGQTVLAKSVRGNGLQDVALNTAGIASGVYTLVVRSSEGSSSRRIIRR